MTGRKEVFIHEILIILEIPSIPVTIDKENGDNKDNEDGKEKDNKKKEVPSLLSL